MPSLKNMTDLQVTIAGSYKKHLDRIVEAKRLFEELGAVVLRPRSETVESKNEGLVLLEGDPDDEEAIQRAQLEAIAESHILYVVNPGGYVGGEATLEVGYAVAAGVTVVTSEPSFEAGVGFLSKVGTPATALQIFERSEGAKAA